VTKSTNKYDEYPPLPQYPRAQAPSPFFSQSRDTGYFGVDTSVDRAERPLGAGDECIRNNRDEYSPYTCEFSFHLLSNEKKFIHQIPPSLINLIYNYDIFIGNGMPRDTSSVNRAERPLGGGGEGEYPTSTVSGNMGTRNERNEYSPYTGESTVCISVYLDVCIYVYIYI
jgi:hypothetical protein